MSALRSFKFAACQLAVGSSKAVNLEGAKKAIKEAAENGAKVIALPECFNCPYSNASFPTFAEPTPGGPSSEMLSDAAKEHKVYLVGGSIPERDTDGKLYNT